MNRRYDVLDEPELWSLDEPVYTPLKLCFNPEIHPTFFIWIGFQKHQIWFKTLVTIISVFYGKAYLIFWHVEKFHLLWLEPTPTLISHHLWQHTGITHILFVKLSLCFYCPKIRETWDYWELHDRFESLSGSAPQNIQKPSLISLNDRFGRKDEYESPYLGKA